MAKIQWHGDRDETHRRVVRQKGMKAATRAKAEEIGAAAEVILAPHHANNADDPRRDSYIEVTSGTVDAFASLVDPDGGAAAIEFYLGPLKRAAYSGLGGGAGFMVRKGRRR